MNTFFMKSKLFILALLCVCVLPSLFAQSSCPESDKISDEIKAHNAEYQKIKADLRSGLYCSVCKDSKTEIERSGIETFEQHLNNVKGEAIPASQKQMDEAHKRYLSKYDNLVSRFNSAVDRCKEKAEQEADRKKQEAERKRKEDERLAQEARRKHEQEQKDAADKKKSDEEKKATAEREAREEADRKAQDQLRQVQEQMERDAELRRQEMEALRQDLMNLQQAMGSRAAHNAQVLQNVRNNLQGYENQTIGTKAQPGETDKPGIPDYVSDKARDMLAEAGDVDEDLLEKIDAAGALIDLYDRGWKEVEKDGIINFFESLGATKPLQFGQTEQLKWIEWGTNELWAKWKDAFEKKTTLIAGSVGSSGGTDWEPSTLPQWKVPDPKEPLRSGEVTFWLRSDLYCDFVDVFIDTQRATISQYYAGGAPDCNASGCAGFLLEAGFYYYHAQCKGKQVTGSVVVSEGRCTLIELKN